MGISLLGGLTRLSWAVAAQPGSHFFPSESNFLAEKMTLSKLAGLCPCVGQEAPQATVDGNQGTGWSPAVH